VMWKALRTLVVVEWRENFKRTIVRFRRRSSSSSSSRNKNNNKSNSLLLECIVSKNKSNALLECIG
jgi:hypothetical protein